MKGDQTLGRPLPTKKNTNANKKDR